MGEMLLLAASELSLSDCYLDKETAAPLARFPPAISEGLKGKASGLIVLAAATSSLLLLLLF